MEEVKKPNIYIAWSNKQDSYSFISTVKTVEALSANPVILEMVKSTDLTYCDNQLVNAKDSNGVLLSECAKKVKENTWRHSNVIEIVKNVDCIIFPGGTDISPTLCNEEQVWHGVKEDSDYSVERDVSDYILMSYAIDHDIPMFAICRGMQLLSILHGAKIIGHLPDYFKELGEEEAGLHRDPNRELFVPHDVDIIDEDSLVYSITKKTHLVNVPSWHHQAITDIKNPLLKVTSETVSNDIHIIESVERKDKTFCIGVQYHPEVAVRKYVEQDESASNFMPYKDAISFFEALKNFKK